MKIFNKVILFLFFGIYSSIYAENPPVPAPPSDGGDTGTPGAPSSPIDMYVFFLIIIAISLVVFYARKYRNHIA